MNDNQASGSHGNYYNCLKNYIASYALSANSLVMVLLLDPDFTVGPNLYQSYSDKSVKKLLTFSILKVDKSIYITIVNLHVPKNI